MNVTAGMLPHDAARCHSARIALTSDQGSQTFAELDDSTALVASGLTGMGLQPGDRVGVLSHNRVEVVHAWLGCERAGLVRVVLHSHFEMPVHVDLLRHVGARALIFDTRFVDSVQEHRTMFGTDLVLIAVGDDPPAWAVPWSQVLDNGLLTCELSDVDEHSPVFIQPTTGTTGSPKPWIVTHRSWHAVIDQNLHHLDTFALGMPAVGPDDVMVHAHALQWATGFQLLYPYLVRGARTVLLDDETFNPEVVLDRLLDEGATGALLPAPMLTPVLDEVERRGGVSHNLRRLVIFFATPELLERTTRLLGPVWCHGFGSTEQGAVTTRLLAAEVSANPVRIGSVGRAAGLFFEIAIVDEQGHRVPNGRIGEIVVRSAMSDSSYWDLPERTAAAFLPGGWFRPADVGYLDDDGFLYYVDRAVDTILTTDGAVYPHSVEAAVLRHHAVAQCGVVGLGNQVIAAVSLKPGVVADPALRDAIATSAAPGLRPYEIPYIVIVDELPTVLGGAKVQRALLRNQLETIGP